jgi:hypothetical protein
MEASVEGPFSKEDKGSYLISYRYSTLDFLYKIGVNVAGNIVPKYQDAQFNFYFPTKKAGKFNLWGIGGTDNDANTPVKDSSKWQSYKDILNYNDIHKTGVIGLTHLYSLKDNKTYIKSVAAVSYEKNISTEDTLDNNYLLHPISRDTFGYVVSRISILLNHKFNSKNILRTGIIYGNYNYSLSAKELDPTLGNLKFLMNAKGNTGLAEYYLQWQHRASENFTINTGLHSMYFLLNDKYSIEPRLGLKWQFNNIMALNAGIGIHSRIESISNYMTEVISPNGSILNPNTDLDYTRAFHAVLGYDYSIREDLHLKIETYYQYLFDVPVQDTVSSYSVLNDVGGINDMTLVNKGTGYNYGVDMTLEKFFTKSYYLMLTSSLYQSKYMGSDGVLRNTFFDGNYIFNALGGKEIKIGKNKNNIFNINMRIIWKGGNRLTPIDMQRSIQEDQTVYFDNRAFEINGPDYFRIDLQLSYRKNKPKYSWIISLDFENLTNRLNVYNEYFDKDTKQIEKNYNLGILPILNFKVEF